MTPFKNPGRFAGLLYVLVSMGGFFSLLYVPGKVIVHGNAAATAANIETYHTLFRLGIACSLVFQILFMWVALALYDLLEGVNRRQAALMLALIAAPLPIVLLNELNSVGAFILAHETGIVSAIAKPQREALAMLFLVLHARGLDIAGIFWGLWLFPLGLLVYRSGFIPRIFGVVLIVSCFAYVAKSLAPFAAFQYQDAIIRWTAIPSAGELLFMLWLLIVGAKPKAAAAAGAGAAIG